jgi:hypothetical protein
MALLDANAQETPADNPIGAVSSPGYSAALARKAAMSMMKAAASQRSSVGMTEIMGSRTGRFTG